MYSHYRKLASENISQYPVALPLILSGMIDAGEYKVKNEDVFNDDFVQYLPVLFDSKKHDTNYINDFIYNKYGNADDKSLPIDKIVKPVFYDEESETGHLQQYAERKLARHLQHRWSSDTQEYHFERCFPLVAKGCICNQWT